MKPVISEQFVAMLQVLAEDQQFTSWFMALHPMAENMRSSVIGALVEQMKRNHEEAEMIAAVDDLRNPTIFDAAYKVVQELTM
jgi:hypothetical protein